MAGEARIGWIVDVQNDFMEPDGRLYVKRLDDPGDAGASEARESIEEAVRWMAAHCDVMVFTGDWHGWDDEEIDPDHPDPARGTYPPHCMGRSDNPEDREGAMIMESIRPSSPVVLEIGSSPERAREVARLALQEGRPVFIRKNRFDVFDGNAVTETFLEGLRDVLGSELRFYVVGVARDVCVTGAVDGMQSRGFSVTAVRDATWGLGLEDEETTLERWAGQGAQIVTTAELPR